VDHKVRDHSLIVRRARPHDALRIARVHVQSWQSTYRGVLPPDYLDSLTPARRLLVWQRVIREADWPRSGVIVAEARRPIIGSLTSPTRDSDSELAAVGELTFIYVLPSWWGQGIGRN